MDILYPLEVWAAYNFCATRIGPLSETTRSSTSNALMPKTAPSKAGNNPAFSSGPHRAGLRSLSMAMVPGIQGQLLEVTVVSCNNLKDTEWISRQDPYVCLEYASTKFRSRTCTDGGKNPVFQQKTVIPLIEGLREISVSVWNSNTLTFDDFIGSGKVQLNKVLSGGYDDSSWPLQTKSGRFAGEVKLIMHYQNAQGIGLIGAQWNLNPVATVYGGAPYSSSPYPPVGAYPASYPPTSYPPIDPAKYPVSTYNAHQAMQQPYPTLPYPTTVYPPQPYPHSPYETPYLHSPYETPSYYPPQGPHHGYYPPC